MKRSQILNQCRMSAGDHTPTPWHVSPCPNTHGANINIVGPGAFIIATIEYDEQIQDVDEPDAESVVRYPCDEENARRIVECVNACDAIENPGEAIPAMIKALQAARAWANQYLELKGHGPAVESITRTIDAALAKVQGAITREN